MNRFEDGPRSPLHKIPTHGCSETFRIMRGTRRRRADDFGPVRARHHAHQAEFAPLHEGMSGDGDLAAAAEVAKRGSFRPNRSVSGGMVERFDGESDGFLALTNLQGKRTLANRGTHLVDGEITRDTLGEAQAHQAGSGERQRVAVAPLELLEASVEVAPQRNYFKVSAYHAQLRLSSKAARPNA